MKVFVAEYVCGGGLADRPIDEFPDGLKQEGAAILRALVEDISEFSETVVVLDDRFDLTFEFSKVISFDPAKPIWAQWIDASRGCDAAIIIAPESDGAMAMGVAMLRSSGIDVVAGSGDFLRISSDKILTAQVLHRAGVAHPLFMTTDDTRMADRIAEFDRFIVKPRDGCGTQGIQTFDSFTDAKSALCQNTILQPWMNGKSASIALVAAGNDQTFLPAVSQSIREGACQYMGGTGPLPDDEQRRAMALASRAIAAMPPTARGFVGVDLILGRTSSEDYVIEINPRLATSYIGLRKIIHGNLAARFFEIETGPVKCKAAADSVSWTPDGNVVAEQSAGVQ